MEQKSTKPNYAKGIFLTKRKAKSGKEYLELSIKTEKGYDKYLCFESEKLDQFGNQMFSIMIKEDKPQKANDLPF
jgi:hypothetical protein